MLFNNISEPEYMQILKHRNNTEPFNSNKDHGIVDYEDYDFRHLFMTHRKGLVHNYILNTYQSPITNPYNLKLQWSISNVIVDKKTTQLDAIIDWTSEWDGYVTSMCNFALFYEEFEKSNIHTEPLEAFESEVWCLTNAHKGFHVFGRPGFQSGREAQNNTIKIADVFEVRKGDVIRFRLSFVDRNIPDESIFPILNLEDFYNEKARIQVAYGVYHLP